MQHDGMLIHCLLAHNHYHLLENKTVPQSIFVRMKISTVILLQRDC